MKKRSVISLSLCLTLLFSLLSNMLAGAAFAKESRAAIVVSVKGTVMVTKAGGSTEYRAFDDMSLNQGDHIRTEDESSIVLQVVDQEDEVTIGPNTEMYISSLLESDEGGKKSKLKVWAGSLWFKVKKLVNADDEFEVETPTAVMSVRGSNGYIETMYGQLFALMTSGVLETTTSSGDGSSDSIHISPGQQIQQSGEQPGDLAENVTPLDIKSFVANASPDIIHALLTSIQDIREENEQFVQDLGSGTKSVDSRTGLSLGTPELQQQFGSNLTNLLANIAKEAIDSNKLPASEVNDLIAKANEGATGERIDLNNVKPFDTSVGLNPDVQKAKEEQLQRQQELRQSALDREKQQQLDKISQNQNLADRLAAERQRQEQGNANAKNEEQQRTNETFQQQGGTGNTGGGTGGNTTTPGGTAGTGGSTGGGNTGGGGTGGGGGEEPDNTPPELAIAHPTAQPYLVNTASQEVSVYAKQGSTVTIYKGDATIPLDTKTGLGATTKVTFAVTLVEGANTFKVTAADSSGNVTTKTATLELDTVSPTLTISVPANEITTVNTKPQNIVLHAEQGSSVSLYKGNATTPLETATGAGATSVTFTLNDLAEGENSYKVTATDTAGNVTTKTLKYVLNTSAPGLSIKHPTLETNTVRTKPQTIEVEAAQGISVSLYKDEATTPLETKQGSGTSTVVFAINDLAEGTNVFKVTATDAAGNTASRTVKYVLDTVAPDLAISHPANEIAYVNAKPQTIVLQSEQGAHVSLYKGDGTTPLDTATGAGATNVTFTLNDLAEGENSYKVTATDAAGNVTTKIVKYVLNTSAPELSIQHPTHETNVVRTKPQTIEVRAAQGISLSLYKGDSLTPLETKQGNGTTNVVFTVQDLAEGLNTFKVTARDAAGNTASQTVNYVLDTLAPSLVVSHPTNEVTYVNSKPQGIVLQAEQGASVGLYNGNSPTPIETATGLGEASITFTLNDLVEGTNTYSIVAIDAAGNVTSKTVHFVLITSGPSLAIVHPYSGVEGNTYYVGSNEQSIRAQVSEGITVRLYKGTNPEPIDTLTGLSSYPVEFLNLGLVEGLNTFRVTATDSLGNVSEKSVKYFLDTIVPGLEVTPSGIVHVNALAQSIFVYAEEGTAVNLYRSGSETPLASATGLGMTTKFPFALNDLSEGTNAFVIVATDSAFNVSSSFVTFEVDTVPPAIPIVTAPTNNSTVNVNKPSFTGTAEVGSIVKVAIDEEQNEYLAFVDSMGNWSYSSLTELSDGPHMFMVKATDIAGNTTSLPNWVNLVVDTTPPGVPVVTAPA
ncbi:Ig-like domain-containing protein, partial [Paenibacillus hemerocallicola]